jgi:hypothetical protein
MILKGLLDSTQGFGGRVKERHRLTSSFEEVAFLVLRTWSWRLYESRMPLRLLDFAGPHKMMALEVDDMDTQEYSTKSGYYRGS